LKHQLRAIQKPKIDHYRLGVVARSAVIRQIVDTAVKAGRSIATPVLIDGESGTGKGVLARAIHYSAEEAPGPFVAVNCGAMTEELVESELFGYTKGAFTGARADGKSGHFEAAAGGTLFLDEIGNMPQTAQAKLLGVLEDRKFLRVGDSREIAVRCRVVAATNADLETAVQAGRFRADLFYRLNVVRLTLPPLRDRREDILPLAEYFIDQFNCKFHKGFRTMTEAAQEKLLAYRWPGNVRELKNCIERIILLEEGDTLQEVHFPFLVPPPAASLAMPPRVSQNGLIPYREAVLALIREAMQRSEGNVVESARLLQMPVHKLRYRIKKYGLGSPTP
jgi:transcriptional regulator with PAS, ATPase and Fis domain